MAKVNNAVRIRFIILSIFLQINSDVVLSQISTFPRRIIVQTKLAESFENGGSAVFSTPEKVPVYIRNRLKEFQDNGYPFAAFEFDSLNYRESEALFNAQVRTGPKVLFGPVVVHGDSTIPEHLISRWTGFRKDEDFSLALAEKIPLKLQAIPFIRVAGIPEIEWFGNQAVLHVYLRKSYSNSLNGLIGFFPGQTAQKKLLVTGNIDASFPNLFNRGIGFQLQWSRFAASSQQALAGLSCPFLFPNGLGLAGKFEFLRQDSLYFSRKGTAELIFPLRSVWNARAGLQFLNASQRITNGIAGSNQSVSSLFFALEMQSSPSDRIDPNRKVLSLQLLPGLKKSEMAEGRKTSSRLEFRSRFQTPVYRNQKRFTLRTSGDFAFVASDNLMLADQFRIGGLRSLRGFNENQFFTTSHAIAGIQPAWLLDSGFLVSLFSEGMLYQIESDLFNPKAYRAALGFGISAEFEAGPSLIQISLANGWMKGIQVQAGTSKIHFGYVARF